MTDITKAITAAREALADIDARGMSFIAAERTTLIDTMRNLLSALDAAQGKAVLLVNAEQLADHRVSGMNAVRAGHQDHARGLHTVPLYVAPQAPPAAVPAGYVLVPVEPTQAMLDAAGMCIVPAGKEWLDQSNRETWAAMLAARDAP